MSGSRPIPGHPPQPPSRRSSGSIHRGLIIAAAILAVAAAAVAFTLHRQSSRLEAALPSPPNLSDHPQILQERVQAVYAALAHGGDRAGLVEQLARLFHANGLNAEAAACWRILHTNDPDHPRWPHFLADLMRQANDYAAMAAWLETTTTLDPGYAPAWLQLADFRLKYGQADAAEQAYRQRLTLLPGDPYARLGLMRIGIQRQRTAEARVLGEDLVRDHPAFPPARNLLAGLLDAQGETEAARRLRNTASAFGRFREAEDPWLDELFDACYDYQRLCIRGLVDNLTGQGDRGQALFERAVSLRPDTLAAYELLGNAHLDQDQAALAVRAYAEGLQRASQETPTAAFYVNFARAHRLNGQPAEAVRVLRRALETLGDEYELHDAIGVAFEAVGDLPSAIAAFERGVTLNPDAPDVRHHLAMALISAHRLDEGVEVLQRTHARFPGHPPTLALLGKIESDSGRWHSAVDYLQPLFEAQPDLPEARANMAYARLQAGAEAEAARDPAAAELHFRAGLAAEPNHPELLLRLGFVLLVQRRPAEAIIPLETAGQLPSANGQDRLLLGQAYAMVGRLDQARQTLRLGAESAEKNGDVVLARRCRELLERLPLP